MAEDLESGIYRGDWWRSGTQEMPQWVNWGSEKQNYGQETSISVDSTMFTASSASPPLEFGLPNHQLLQKRERNMLEDKATTFRPTIRQDQTATQHDNSLSSSNLGSNTTRRFPVIPPFFPAAISDDETCLSWSTVPSSLKPSYPNQYQPSNQSFFFHNSPSSNTSPESSGDRCSSGSLFSQNLPGKPILTKDSSYEMKKTNIGSATKRPRLDTPPFTTFKVRKEKLGDRVTALQQLVSPFGKTDTASVLFEAIEYIKFLHEQVTVLSNPYMKLSLDNSDTGEENALRSRGLCLVPVSTTMHVAKENTADFWAPTFGGSYR